MVSLQPPVETYEERLRTVGALVQQLEEGIERNIALARRMPSMRTYYAKVARYQNTWLRSERRIFRRLSNGTYTPTPRPARTSRRQLEAEIRAARNAAFDAKLAHDRAIAATPTPAMLKEFACRKLRPYVDRGDSLAQIQRGQWGTCGPACDGLPRYDVQVLTGNMWSDGEVVQTVKRGQIGVVLGAGETALWAVFNIADLVAEMRSPVTQLDMFAGVL